MFWWPMRRTIVFFFAFKMIWIVNKTKLLEMKKKENLTMMCRLAKYLLEKEEMVCMIQALIVIIIALCLGLLDLPLPDRWRVWSLVHQAHGNLLVQSMINMCFDFLDVIVSFRRLKGMLERRRLGYP